VILREAEGPAFRLRDRRRDAGATSTCSQSELPTRWR